MNRNIKILIGAAILILLGLIIFAVFFLKQGTTQTPLAGTINIKNLQGQDVAVTNFESSAILNYQDTPLIESNDKYSIQYDKKNNVFQIYLNIVDAADLQSYRVEAETLLAQKLGKTLPDLCSLPIVETVPDNGTVSLPVYNYGPSVCDK